MRDLATTIEPTPRKRVFFSIIPDYDLNKAICELVDNAIDEWVKAGRKRALDVRIDIDLDQQTIRIIDNAGGVDLDHLDILIAPGLTSNDPTAETIGIFGVGTKRAVVALAQHVTITTRKAAGLTYRIEFDDEWLKEESWKLDVYRVDNIPENSTLIHLTQLRFKIDEAAVDALRHHLSATYARFLSKDFSLKLDGDRLEPVTFDTWAFPEAQPPRRYHGPMPTADGQPIQVELAAGLIQDGSDTDEYGVYLYCNDRLVARGLKDHRVGFARGLAGLAHHEVSLVRVIISLRGEAQSMPWNSSKSDLNERHPVFVELRQFTIDLVKHFASLSRALRGTWDETVFPHRSGDVHVVAMKQFSAARKARLPPLPPQKPRYEKKARSANEPVHDAAPWTRGLTDGMIAVEMIFRSNLSERNRIALILLDSNLEIAFKEYIVNGTGTYVSDSKITSLFSKRHLVHEEVKLSKPLTNRFWNRVTYYYDLRCKLVHERATVPISDASIEEFRKLVRHALSELFGLEFPE